MFRWGKSRKGPAPAGSSGGAVATGEVAVKKVEKIEVRNVIHIKPPIGSVAGGGNLRKPPAPSGADDASKARKPGSPDIDSMAEKFIKDIRGGWSVSHKSFRATGR